MPSGGRIAVRPARADDAGAVAALAASVQAMHAAALPDVFQPADPPGLTAGDFARMIERAGPLFLVAERDGGFAGYAHAELREEPATALKRASRVLYLVEMAVVPGARHHGVGRALLAAVRAAAVERRAQGITLNVYTFNSGARAFYTREGFEPLSERLVARLEARDAELRPGRQ